MYGEMLTDLPADFVIYNQWPEYYLAGDDPKILHPKQVGRTPVGVRRGIWPLYVEEYVSDIEPDLSLSDPEGTAPHRIFIWQRVGRKDVPQGWHMFSSTSKRLEGVAKINGREYWRNWSESARRYRKKWHLEYIGKKYQTEKISYAEFKAAYLQSSVAEKISQFLLDTIEKKLSSPYKDYIELWAARDISTGTVRAGMAILNSPSHKSSYYISGFICKEAFTEPVMIGLMDNWFFRSYEQGIHYLFFGGFWVQGNPKRWKGFSNFKAKFGLQYVLCPPVLYRFGHGKLW